MEVEMGISAAHKRCCMHKPMGLGLLDFGKYQTYSTLAGYQRQWEEGLLVCLARYLVGPLYWVINLIN